MRLLHVVPRMDPRTGGVCQAVRTIIAGLAELEVHNEVVSLDSAEAAFLQHETFPVHALGPGKGPWDYNARLLPWLAAELPRFDAVVVHGLWLFYGYAVQRARRRLQAKAGSLPKVFVMPHGMLDPYFQRAAGRKLKAIRNVLYWKFIERHLLNEADAILFTCEEERRLAQQTFRPYHPRQTVVVGLGVEEPPAQQAAMQQALAAACPALGTQPYLLFLSRIHEKKGVDLLLDAYAASYAAAPAGQVPRLLLAGPGLDTPYGQRMQQQVAASPVLREAVLFAGMLTGAAKWGAFYSCEAFVLPSHQENFGIAVVEALACARPVLISDQVNIWREIEAGHGGLVAADTLPGTQRLLARWQQLAASEKADFQRSARATFEAEFAVPSAALRFRQAVQ